MNMGSDVPPHAVSHPALCKSHPAAALRGKSLRAGAREPGKPGFKSYSGPHCHLCSQKQVILSFEATTSSSVKWGWNSQEGA